MRATSCHLTYSKSAWKSTPMCTRMCWRVWGSPGAITWPVQDPGCGSRTRRRPTRPKRPRHGFRSATALYPFFIGPSPRPEPAGLFHTSRTSPTWPPTTPKLAWSPPSAEYSLSPCRRLCKRHASNSGSVSRRWLKLKAVTCQLYYKIKLTELFVSIKVLK